ncbi:MAG TPA: ABC transporter substrate-binding protein [Alphaproteobacteria bacterium]
MISRRELMTLVGGAATWPLLAQAQQPAPPLRVGFLGAISASVYARRIEALRAGLRDLGYVEGKNLTLETRWADSRYDRLAAVADELIRLNVDVIVTHGTPGTRAAMAATATIPIVMATSGDAVASKLVSSLARPGGNVTGTSFFSPEIHAKRLELLKQVLPQLTRVAFLVNPANFSLIELDVQRARSIKIEVEVFKTEAPNDFESAFSAMAKSPIEAVMVQTDALFRGNLSAIASLAAARHLPSAGDPGFARAGGLIGYGPDFLEMFRRAAYFIDKIAKGAKPADLPVEQPTSFEIAVNLKTATALGLEVPATLLARADEVIE